MNTAPTLRGILTKDNRVIWAESLNLGVKFTTGHKAVNIREYLDSEEPLIYISITEKTSAMRPVILHSVEDMSKHTVVRNRHNSMNVEHWSGGWFSSAYSKWVLLHAFPRRTRSKVLGYALTPSKNHVKSNALHQITISQLLAAYASFAYLCDIDDDVNSQTTPESLIDLYIEKNKMIRRHGGAIISTARKALLPDVIQECLTHNQNLGKYEPMKCGVDLFIFHKSVNQRFRHGD